MNKRIVRLIAVVTFSLMGFVGLLYADEPACYDPNTHTWDCACFSTICRDSTCKGQRVEQFDCTASTGETHCNCAPIAD